MNCLLGLILVVSSRELGSHFEFMVRLILRVSCLMMRLRIHAPPVIWSSPKTTHTTHINNTPHNSTQFNSASCCFSETGDRWWCNFKALAKYTGNHTKHHDSSFSTRRFSEEQMREICGTTAVDFWAGPTKLRRTTCLSTGERRTSAPQTWIASTRNCTHSSPSRHLTR